MAPGDESFGIRDEGFDRRCRDWSYAWDCHEPPHIPIYARLCDDFTLERIDPQAQGLLHLFAEVALHHGAKRIVTRDLFEAEHDQMRAMKGTEAFERSERERKKVEMLFAHLKRNLELRRLRLRGLSGASDEFLLPATVQNLKKLVRFPAHGPPTAAACTA